jgi:hypothetical protein
MNLVHIKTFSSSIPANMCKSMLAANEIEAHLFNEYTSYTNPEINYSSGGIRLMVNKENELKAIEIIKLTEEGKL